MDTVKTWVGYVKKYALNRAYVKVVSGSPLPHRSLVQKGFFDPVETADARMYRNEDSGKAPGKEVMRDESKRARTLVSQNLTDS